MFILNMSSFRLLSVCSYPELLRKMKNRRRNNNKRPSGIHDKVLCDFIQII